MSVLESDKFLPSIFLEKVQRIIWMFSRSFNKLEVTITP